MRRRLSKIFAASCLAGLIIAGATALAYAAPSASGPSLSNATTTTTSATNARALRIIWATDQLPPLSAERYWESG